MAKYAQFDPAAQSPQRIIGWYDTGFFAYPNLPSQDALIEVSDDDWSAHLGNPSGWVNNGGTLGQAVAPAPTLGDLAMVAIGTGLTIALSGTVTLAATLFPVDPVTQIKLNGVISVINTTGGFPGGAVTYPIKDASGAWHSFTLDQYKAVAAAIANYVAALDLIIDGNPLSATDLPTNAVSLTV